MSFVPGTVEAALAGQVVKFSRWPWPELLAWCLVNKLVLVRQGPHVATCLVHD